MATLPPVSDRPFNQELKGVFGEFGAGAGVRALYLQSAIEPVRLDRISLLGDVEGSGKWSVRDLFQREVDQERVRRRLLPYLAARDKVKFFNPLTLTLLPETGGSFEAPMPPLEESTLIEGPYTWRGVFSGDDYRLRRVEGHPEFATLEWNDTRVRLVAIDGQHRLSALKRLWTDHATTGREDLAGWRIPIVVVVFRGEERPKSLPRLVEVVRNLFVYINTTAQVVSPARQILLSDESPAAVCTQEVLERSHRNDLLPLRERDPECLPLLFFDWRGAEHAGKQVRSAAAVKGVEEVRDWLLHYLLRPEADAKEEHPDEFTAEVRTALGIEPPGPLHDAFERGRLDHRSNTLLREHFRGHLLPFLEQVLQRFTPYRQYVSDLRRLEDEYCAGPSADLARHAFDEMRFGTSRARDLILDSVRHERREIEGKIERLKKQHLHGLLRHDIGMRGVMSAFGALRGRLRDPSWAKYTPRFVEGLNRLLAAGWLDPERGEYRKHLRHLATDHNGDIVNYRLHQAPDALGAYLELLVAAYGGPWPESWTGNWRPHRETLLSRLDDTVTRGYKREMRPILREDFPKGGRDLTNAVNAEAKKKAQAQIRTFREAVNRIAELYDGC